MGNLGSCKNPLKSIKSKEEIGILITGMEFAGKTSILYKLNIGEVNLTIPTIGFLLERVQFQNLNFASWELGCQIRLKMLWNYFNSNIRGIIVVIDSNDRYMIDLLSLHLTKLLSEERLSQIPILFFANKQDLPNLLDNNEIIEKLELYSIRGRIWNIQGCSAISGDGLYEGIEWLSQAINLSL